MDKVERWAVTGGKRKTCDAEIGTQIEGRRRRKHKSIRKLDDGK